MLPPLEGTAPRGNRNTAYPSIARFLDATHTRPAHERALARRQMSIFRAFDRRT